MRRLVEVHCALTTRVPGAPDVPTLAESGYPGLEVLSWYGVLAPAGTPQGIVRKLNADTARWAKVVNDAGIRID